MPMSLPAGLLYSKTRPGVVMPQKTETLSNRLGIGIVGLDFRYQRAKAPMAQAIRYALKPARHFRPLTWAPRRGVLARRASARA
jgi:hypothetical protein